MLWLLLWYIVCFCVVFFVFVLFCLSLLLLYCHFCYVCQIVRRVVVRCGTCLYVTCLTNKKINKKKRKKKWHNRRDARVKLLVLLELFYGEGRQQVLPWWKEVLNRLDQPCRPGLCSRIPVVVRIKDSFYNAVTESWGTTGLSRSILFRPHRLILDF